VASLLRRFADLAESSGEPERAARLAGAAAAEQETVGGLHHPTHRTRHERHLAAPRDSLGEQAFAAAWSEGRAMSLDQAVAEALSVGDLPPAVPPATGGLPLTKREQEVAAIIALGLTNPQIAAELVVAERTAMNHVDHILTKLGMHSRAQVAAWAVQHGLHHAHTL
jgi:non-specific serine/threonine protein kinase